MPHAYLFFFRNSKIKKIGSNIRFTEKNPQADIKIDKNTSNLLKKIIQKGCK